MVLGATIAVQRYALTIADVNRTERFSIVMASLKWTACKPATPGWYWYRGPAGEADPLIVQVDEAGQFQWPDGAFQEVSLTKGEWAGPLEAPEEP